VKAVSGAAVTVLLAATPAWAQQPSPCRVLCSPEFKIEPTITFTNLFGSPRIISDDGTVTRESRDTQFELILSLGLPTRLSWLEFTFEAIFLPFDRDSTPELEFETNFIWLPSERTREWVTSHFDIVDKFSAAANHRLVAHPNHIEVQHRGYTLALLWCERAHIVPATHQPNLFGPE